MANFEAFRWSISSSINILVYLKSDQFLFVDYVKEKSQTPDLTLSFNPHFLKFQPHNLSSYHHTQMKNEPSGADHGLLPGSAGGSPIGKKHALKKYDQFALNTSCFWVICAISRYFCYKNDE